MEFVIVTLSKDDVCRILYQESQGALESAIGKRDIHGRLLTKSAARPVDARSLPSDWKPDGLDRECHTQPTNRAL